MTEQIKILESFKETFSGTDNINAIDTAIRSLEAWSEVLNELEENRKGLVNTEYDLGVRKGIGFAIDIIKQKLEQRLRNRSKYGIN